jgi:hypothetical protein
MKWQTQGSATQGKYAILMFTQTPSQGTIGFVFKKIRIGTLVLFPREFCQN